jgi:PAS domain-containing protein
MSTAGQMSSSAVADRLPGLCISGDDDQRYLYLNDPAEDIYQYDRQETFSGTVRAHISFGAVG